MRRHTGRPRVRSMKVWHHPGDHDHETDSHPHARRAAGRHQLRFRRVVTPDQWNRYSIALPPLGSSRVHVYVWQYWTGEGTNAYA